MAEQLFAGRYRLIEKLGTGGMSEVWAAEDVELARHVALKLLAPQADTERFRREARAVAALAHPNINQLYDFGEADGRPYMVLECLASGSLDERLAPGRPLADGETRRVAADIAAGLAHAHERGLVHRDLKPGNILFDSEGRAKIADFGIARLGGAGTLTEAGTVIGTATTISPEQAVGEPAAPASDVYSFGVLLFWMLTGRPPFLSDRPLDLLALHRDAVPPAVASVRADAPADLAGLAAAALAKDPAIRPADGAALVHALRPVSATATMPLTPVRRRRRIPASVLAVAVLTGLAAAGAAVAYAVVHDSGSASPARATTAAPSLALPTVSTSASTSAAAPAQTTASSSTSTATATAAVPTTRPLTTVATPPPPSTVATTDLTPTDTATTAAPATTGPPAQGTTTVGSPP